MHAPTPLDPLLEHAWQSSAAGDIASALSLAQQAYAQDPTHAPAATALGYFLLHAGQHEAAHTVLVPAAQQWPQSATLQWYAGLAQHQLGHAEAAIALLRWACTLDPGLHDAAFTLAWALHDHGEQEEALYWAHHALAAQRSAPRLLQTGWLLQQTGQHADAAEHYQQAIARYPADAAEQRQLHLQLAECQMQLGQSAQAGVTLDAGLRCFPDDPGLLTTLAHLQWQRGDRLAAIALARQLTERDPERVASWHLLGAFLQDSGDWLAADPCFDQVQRRDLSQSDALFRRAQIQARAGRPIDAQWLLQQVLHHQPDAQPAQTLMAQVLLDMRQANEARRQLLRWLRAAPRHSERWRLLAIAHQQRNRPALARRALQRALRLDPENIEALRLLAWVALAQHDRPAAIHAANQLLARRPDDISTQIQAAFVHAMTGDQTLAARCAEQAVAHAPDNAEAWRALSQVRYQQQRLPEAEDAIDIALQLAPDRLDSLRQLGWILIARQRLAHAELVFLRVQALAPDDPVAQLELAEVRLRAGQFVAGLASIDALQTLGPLSAPAQLTQARLLIEGGQALQQPQWHADALAICRRLLADPARQGEVAALLVRLRGLGVDAARPLSAMLPHGLWRLTCQQALNTAITQHGHTYFSQLAQLAGEAFPDQPWLALAGLYADSLSARSTPEQLAWRARNAFRQLKLHNGLSPTWGMRRPRTGSQRVRIAYVASQQHERLLQRVLASHDPAHVEVFVFTALRLSGLPAHLHCQPLDLDQLDAACAANQIDVLIDAGGLQPFEGQYALLERYARRLAPVQVGWLGSWGSAGGLFDALLTDRVAVPLADESQYEEAIWTLDGGQWSWDPPLHAPTPRPSPAATYGWVTFGVTARGLRLNEGSLRAWAAIVVATPLSRLRLIGAVSLDWPQRAEILATLQRHGVSAERVSFDPPCAYADWLTWFQQVDIVLDSFPGNGGLSLLDALWMGVPVVSRSGSWLGARQGASILHSLGQDGWVADSEAGLIAAAVALAHDLPALQHARAQLRQRMRHSPLLDGRRIASQIEQHCAAWLDRYATAHAGSDLKQAVRSHAQAGLHAWLDKPANAIHLPSLAADDTPALSVVLILYNQAGLTLRTLQALADQRGATFETLIIDNASSDQTDALLARVRGATIVRNRDNLGFVLAANQGAAMARGRHLLLLNNDAIVQPGALAATCRRLDADPTIGALGGRIVLMSGGLQEAGNVIFQDGSTAGIGRGEDPFSPAALARRCADYCSGVYLAVPLALWRMLDGFDRDFVPAYYEDADFCLRVWQAGFRVEYAPEILVEHLEWGSAGNNEAQQRMRDNRLRFVAKHGDWLSRQPRPGRTSLDDDRWRSPADTPRLPRVLILDNEVPHMARGGGLPRARLMLQALRDWPVTLFPLWSFDDDWAQVYASIPDTVEVMLGLGLAQLEGFLERRRGQYDVLWVSRPPNLQALAPLRARRPELFAGMRLIYDSEALFALREIGELAVKGRALTPAQAQARLDAELALAQDVDQVVVVSERDARLFRERGHPVAILSHAMPVRRSVPSPKRRAGLVFVGALHPDTPNEDGLLWFVEQVIPRLRALLPEPPLLEVVGECRSVRLAALASADFRLLGPQADLRPCYDRAKVFIAPVRFAGGVPVKVIEAAAQGIPVVASAILLRQLGWQDGLEIQGARDADAFAHAIARLLTNEALWRRQQAAAWARCAADYHPDDFARQTRALLLATPTQEAT